MTTETVREVLIDAIAVVTNPRKRFDDAKLQSLAASIETDGLLQPILVRDRWPGLDGGKGDGPEKNGHPRFELVAGERRLRAHQLLGRDMIPATIRVMDARQAARIRLVENLHREDLHELDEALAFRELLEDEAYTVGMLAAECGRSESYVYQRLKLLDLADEARDAFQAGEIPAAHALAIARLQPEDQKKALDFAAGWNGQPLSTAALQSRIAREILLELKNAPFDPDDAELVPDAGGCAACPKRTGNAPGLWPELEDGDRCTDRKCFDTKVDAALHAAVEGGCVPIYHSYEDRPKGFKGAVSVNWDTLLNRGDNCPHRERAIHIGGRSRGERAWICREKTCSKHGKTKSGLSAAEKRKRVQEKERLRRRRAVADILQERIRERVAIGDEEPVVQLPHARVLASLLFRTLNSTDQKGFIRQHGLEPVKIEGEYVPRENSETPFSEALASWSLAEVWDVVWRLALHGVVERAGWQYHRREEAMQPIEDLANALGYQPHNAWRSVRAAAELELPEDSE